MPVFSKRIGSPALVAAIGASLLLAVSSADAAPIVNFAIDVHGATGGPYSNNFNQNGPVVSGSLASTTPGEWSIDWGPFSADDDPEGGDGVNLNSVFTVQNTHTSNLQFSILVSIDTLPADAIAYGVGCSDLVIPCRRKSDSFALPRSVFAFNIHHPSRYSRRWIRPHVGRPVEHRHSPGV
jgi:hypothetical protein